jgi:GT2 family glycosyltransferase
LDDDAFVKDDYVETLIEYFSKHPDVQAVGGKIVPVYETQEPKWMSKYLLTLVSALDMGDNVKGFPSSKFPIGANMAFRATVFDKYGLFNVELGRRADGLEGGDEKEVFIRLRGNNELIHYVPSIEVEHIIPEKRTRKEYIKGLGIGVGSSEMKRLKSATLPEKLKKYFSEIIKSIGSIILFLIYMLNGKWAAAKMLIQFRIWVWKGLITK